MFEPIPLFGILSSIRQKASNLGVVSILQIGQIGQIGNLRFLVVPSILFNGGGRLILLPLLLDPLAEAC